MPFVVIEGSDGTGKSTLAETIYEKVAASGDWHAHLEHYGVPKYDPSVSLTIGEQAMDQLLEREAVKKFNMFTDFVVWDRSHWGEPVYAPIFRPDRCVDPLFGTLQHREFYHVETWLQSIGAVNVYCTLDTDTIVERIGGRDADDITDEDPEKRRAQVERIKGRYDLLTRYIGNPARRNPTRFATVELREPADTVRVAETVIEGAIDVAAAKLREMTSPFVRPNPDVIVEKCRPTLFADVAKQTSIEF